MTPFQLMVIDGLQNGSRLKWVPNEIAYQEGTLPDDLDKDERRLYLDGGRLTNVEEVEVQELVESGILKETKEDLEELGNITHITLTEEYK